MTGGGFYVVSFVSCSSCFMLKFSGHYVIKLLGVWRAQAPPFLVFCTLGHVSPGWARPLDVRSNWLWCEEGRAVCICCFMGSSLNLWGCIVRRRMAWGGGTAVVKITPRSLNIPKQESFLSGGRGWGVRSSRLCGPRKCSLSRLVLTSDC